MGPDKNLEEVLQRYDKSLCQLVTVIADVCTEIAANLAGKTSRSGGLNIFGENQLEVDVWSNDLLLNRLEKSGVVAQAASEELKDVKKWKKDAEYSVVLDPLDGSSNLVSNNLLGTIVGIYRNMDLPGKGTNLYASMYFLYGPYLELVLATSEEVYLFFATEKRGQSAKFLSTGEPFKIPPNPTVYGIGGARAKWTYPIKRFAEILEQRLMSLRYGGSFVGDYNQVFMKGGFFAYPELSDAPNGKYRLQFESNPLAFITEKAGGSASTGDQKILEVVPQGVSQRVPTYLGNSSLVEEFESIYIKNKKA